MATGVFAKGTVIQRSPDSGSNWTTIDNVGTISGPNSTADSLDVSNQDTSSRVRQWISGLVSPGSVSFSCNYDPADTIGTASHNDLLRDSTAGTALDFRILFASGSDSMTFPGVVTKAELSAPVDAPLMLDVEITITGAITWPT